MMKRLIYIGLLLLAISIISYYAIYSSVVSLSSSGFGQNITRVYDNYSLSGNSINIFSFNSTTGNASIYLERSNLPLDVFLLNHTGYSLWRTDINGSATAANYLAIAKRLEGNGAIILYSNVTNATIPVTFSKPIYSQNESNLSFGILGRGRFYVLSAISANSSVHDATVKSTLAEGVSISNSANKLSEFSFVGMVVTIMLIAGLVIILVGIMKQDKKKQSEEIKPEIVDELYKGIKNSSSENHTAKRPKQSSKR
ncbi:MAG: hypothetical protein QXR73_00710 [Candidatus Micrarchaeaceae archaeon]